MGTIKAAYDLPNLIVVNSSSEFDSAIKEGKSIAMYMADWCDPCVAAVQSYVGSQEFQRFMRKQRINSVYIDTDNLELSEIIRKRRIIGTPLIDLKKDGIDLDFIVGFAPVDKLVEKLKQYF